MEVTGRLTADAVVRTVSGDRKVVGFTLAINDSYLKDGERVEQAVFVECSYWRNTGLAEYLAKGTLVQVYGRLGVNAYIAKDGEARGQITFHVTEAKLFGGSPVASGSQRKNENVEEGKAAVSAGASRKGAAGQAGETISAESETNDPPF